MSFDTKDVERKTLAILKVLQSLEKPAGARLIAQHLKDYGVVLSERAVRYHLKLMDERGLTELVGNLDGRTITENGIVEIKRALVNDKVGMAITKIEQLAFKTNFDYVNQTGIIPVNVSIFDKDDFSRALQVMRPVFEKGLCVSKKVVYAEGGQPIGEVQIPEGKIGLGTVCSVVINGALLKAGIPMDSRLSGILQIQDRLPVRFTEIIHYNACSLDPTEIFIRANMTSVIDAAATGNGEILANFREIPAICAPLYNTVVDGLKSAGIDAVLVKGNTSEPVCELSVDQNKDGLVLVGGLNPVAAVQEAGIEAENHSMSTMVDFSILISFSELNK